MIEPGCPRLKAESRNRVSGCKEVCSGLDFEIMSTMLQGT